MTLAVDAVLSYIACGAAAVTDHLLISPTAPAAAPSTVLTSVPVPPASGKQPPINSGSRVVSGLPQSPSETVIGGTLAVGPSSSTSPAANGTIDRAAGSNGGNMGMIVGGVVGCLAVVGLSVIGVIYLLRRRTITTASDRSHERPATATPRRFSYWPSTTRTRPLAPFFSADSGIGGGQEVKKTAVAEMYAEYPRDESRDPWARKYGAGNYDRYRNSSRELARGPAELPS